MYGNTVGLTVGDTRSSDYSSSGLLVIGLMDFL